MIDTHAHLFLCKRPENEIFDLINEQKIDYIINVGIDIKTILETVNFSQKHKNVFPTFGIHPCYVDDQVPSYQQLKEYCAQYRFTAIGEVGVDLYWDKSKKDLQISTFKMFLELAREVKLPVIIHNRNADNEIYDVIKEYPDVKKVLHCFDSSLDFIKQTENLNCIYSFTGLITISDYEKHAENLNYLKWDQIMLETDSPYLIPRENKKPIKVRKLKENGPFLLPYIVNKVAEYKMCTSDTVVSETTKTAKTFFNICD